MPFKVAILIPTTTRRRQWKNIKETDLYKVNLKSFLLTYCKEHSYTYYLGVDLDDPLYSKASERKELARFINIMKNVSFQFIPMQNIKKGHLTVMWNRLFEKAYKDGCHYFYQCGDDVQFINKGWVSKSINLLQLYHNLGATGPHDRMQTRVHTQSFVSRKHYEIFKFYFPPEIINWFCDDWITKVYWEDLLFPLLDKWCMNSGGAPRYLSPRITRTYDSQKKIADKLIARDRKRLSYVLKHSNLVFPKNQMKSLQNTMKIGFKENEIKYGKLVNTTYKTVLDAVTKQNNKDAARIDKLIGMQVKMNKSKPKTLMADIANQVIKKLELNID